MSIQSTPLFSFEGVQMWQFVWKEKKNLTDWLKTLGSDWRNRRRKIEGQRFSKHWQPKVMEFYWTLKVVNTFISFHFRVAPFGHKILCFFRFVHKRGKSWSAWKRGSWKWWMSERTRPLRWPTQSGSENNFREKILVFLYRKWNLNMPVRIPSIISKLTVNHCVHYIYF